MMWAWLLVGLLVPLVVVLGLTAYRLFYTTNRLQTLVDVLSEDRESTQQILSSLKTWITSHEDELKHVTKATTKSVEAQAAVISQKIEAVPERTAERVMERVGKDGIPPQPAAVPPPAPT